MEEALKLQLNLVKSESHRSLIGDTDLAPIKPLDKNKSQEHMLEEEFEDNSKNVLIQMNKKIGNNSEKHMGD